MTNDIEKQKGAIKEVIDIAYMDANQDAECGELDQAEEKRELIISVEPLMNTAPELLNCLEEGEDIISGLEAELDNAGTGDLVEVRDWWRKASLLIAKAKGVKS